MAISIFPAAGKVLCDAISTAEITYKDSNGEILFTENMGTCESGETIQIKVPEPENIVITVC